MEHGQFCFPVRQKGLTLKKKKKKQQLGDIASLFWCDKTYGHD